jgi:hypothetical protein
MQKLTGGQVKGCLEMEMEGKGGRGRPWRTWIDTDDMKAQGITKETAIDKNK